MHKAAVLVVLALAGCGAPEPTGAVPPRGVLSGIVVDDAFRPIGGAHVAILAENVSTTTPSMVGSHWMCFVLCQVRAEPQSS
ncbi:MAG: hypothetical protein ACYC2H_00355 [Thermoplasmatota archaeon]